jgi:hypothetical protein
MTEARRRRQLNFGEGLIAEEVADLREAWMTHADQVLNDERLVTAVYEALARRSPQSRTRGRRGTPAEVVLRSPGESGIPRLHPRGSSQGAGCQDHGPLGIGIGAAGDRKDS